MKIFTEESVTDNEILLLSKGLKYVPSPPLKRTKSDLIKDFNEFARKLRCKFHFDEGNDYKYHPSLPARVTNLVQPTILLKITYFKQDYRLTI